MSSELVPVHSRWPAGNGTAQLGITVSRPLKAHGWLTADHLSSGECPLPIPDASRSAGSEEARFVDQLALLEDLHPELARSSIVARQNDGVPHARTRPEPIPTVLKPDSTLIAVLEMSQSAWLVAGLVPGIERHPLKKIELDEAALLRLLRRWQEEATKAGHPIIRTLWI